MVLPPPILILRLSFSNTNATEAITFQIPFGFRKDRDKRRRSNDLEVRLDPSRRGIQGEFVSLKGA